MSKTKAPSIDEWEVKNGVDTLQRAEEIKTNPALMKRIQVEVVKQKKALDKVAVKVKAKPVKKVVKKKGKK